MRLTSLLTCAGALAQTFENPLQNGLGPHHVGLDETTKQSFRKRFARKKFKRQQPPAYNDDPDNTGDYTEIDHSRYTDEFDMDDSMLTNLTSVCILQPEADAGPYYVKNIPRRSMFEDDGELELGVKFAFTMLVYDVETCEPIGDAYVDFWMCTAWGDYSGIYTPDNANGTDVRDKYFGRELAGTHSQDIYLLTVFPGHAENRTTHISFAVYANATRDGGHLDGDFPICHIGELYFDQQLIDRVAEEFPYNQNEREVVLNKDDNQLKLMQGPDAPDPFVNYYFDEEDEEPTIYAWIKIGVNTSAVYEPQYRGKYEYPTDDDINLIFSENPDFSYTTPASLLGEVAIPTRTGDINTSSRPYFRESTSGSESADSSSTAAETETKSTASSNSTNSKSGSMGSTSGASDVNSANTAASTAGGSSGSDYEARSSEATDTQAENTSDNSANAAAASDSASSTGADASNGEVSTVPGVLAALISGLIFFMCI